MRHDPSTVEGMIASPYRLADSISFAPQSSDKTSELHVDLAWPSGDPPPEGWPLLLALDGERSFATIVDTARRMASRPDATGVHDMAVAAVHLPGHADRKLRFDDFAGPGARAPETGFAKKLERVVASIHAALPIDPTERTLMGHSLSGFFVLRTMAAACDLFRRYVALSPSIWVDREGLFSALEQLPADAVHLFLAVGGWEEGLAPWQIGQAGSDSILDRRTERRMVTNVRDLGALGTRRRWCTDGDVRVFAEDDHASIVTSAMPHALRFAARRSS